MDSQGTGSSAMSHPGNALGWLAGLASSPLTGLISALRRSRMFHPSGLLFRAEVKAVPGSAAAGSVAARLVGPALVRWSSALWKDGASHGGQRAERPDVLGCAIRFSRDPLGTQPQPEDQDLLLATIQRPWSMPLAPATTRQHDFLANYYYGVSPFEVPPLGRIEWRLVPEALSETLRQGGARPPAATTRAERLAAALRGGSANLLLEWAAYSGPLHRPAAKLFTPLVRLELTAELELDQEALRFHPFRTGRGIQPVGFVHAMRRATYLTSQALRPGHQASAPAPEAAPLLPKTPRG